MPDLADSFILVKKTEVVNRAFSCKVRRKKSIKVLGNSVPAAAGKQRERALFNFTGCKRCVGGHYLESLRGMVTSRRILDLG